MTDKITMMALGQDFYEEAPPTVQTELLADYAESLLDNEEKWDMFHLFVYNNNKEILESEENG
ncbi:MAG TPA: hypothetical protein PLZ69_02800 [Candidatus Pacearchaeota archaeon]|nr:hypothetical protein [Candidatus Pacearchaeota archaeon]